MLSFLLACLGFAFMAWIGFLLFNILGGALIGITAGITAGVYALFSRRSKRS